MQVHRKFILMFLAIPFFFFSYTESVFDNVDWGAPWSKGKVKVYVNTSHDVNYYKAETVVKGLNGKKIFDKLLEFSEYPKIFPKTLMFKYLETTEDNKYIIYSRLNFAPMKNRDYFIEISAERCEDEFYIYWYPKKYEKYCSLIDDDCKRVEFVHGRWTLKTLKDRELYLSIEYYNDWKIKLTRKMLTFFERQVAANSINELLSYAGKQKKYTLVY